MLYSISIATVSCRGINRHWHGYSRGYHGSYLDPYPSIYSDLHSGCGFAHGYRSNNLHINLLWVYLRVTIRFDSRKVNTTCSYYSISIASQPCSKLSMAPCGTSSNLETFSISLVLTRPSRLQEPRQRRAQVELLERQLHVCSRTRCPQLKSHSTSTDIAMTWINGRPYGCVTLSLT